MTPGAKHIRLTAILLAIGLAVAPLIASSQNRDTMPHKSGYQWQLPDNITEYRDSLLHKSLAGNTLTDRPIPPKESHKEATKTTDRKEADTLIFRRLVDTPEERYIRESVDTGRILNIKIDTLRHKSKLARKFHDIFSYTPAPAQKLTTERPDKQYEGYIIDSIIIIRIPAFDENVKNKFLRWHYRVANNVHVLTRQEKIRKDILIKPGDRLNFTDISRNEVFLREQNFVNDVQMLAQPDDTPGHVVLTVFVRDKFSIGGEFESDDDDSKLSIYDNNFLGTGNTLKFTNYINFNEKRFAKAGDISYRFNNLLGTFTDLTTTLGYGDRGNYFTVHNRLFKPYIKPTDIAGGLDHNFSRDMEDIASMDSVIRTTSNIFSAWAGASVKVAPKETALFFNIRYEYRYFMEGPFVNRWVNRYYHNNKSLLVTFGIYREHFYRGNLIYGFGRTEDIAYGFKAEILGGYSWGRYDNIPYIGARLSSGHRTRLGYLTANAQWGSYISSLNRYNQMITRFDMLFFTHLVSLRRNYHLRQFFKFGTIIGSNMMVGHGQTITFNGNYKLRDVNTNNTAGTSRLYFSPETVIFSPWHVFGFRFSLYSFLDSGTLGFDNNPFKNKFYTAVGIGIRFRNEKLSFSALQLRLSYLIKGSPTMSSQYFRFGHEQRLNDNRFIPTEPGFINFE